MSKKGLMSAHKTPTAVESMTNKDVEKKNLMFWIEV